MRWCLSRRRRHELRYIPALNAGPAQVALLGGLCGHC